MATPIGICRRQGLWPCTACKLPIVVLLIKLGRDWNLKREEHRLPPEGDKKKLEGIICHHFALVTFQCASTAYLAFTRYLSVSFDKMK